MITYELAKKLKDAGFPQISNPTIEQGFYLGQGSTIEELEESVFIPTFSELIEACGDELSDITRIIDGWITNNESSIDSQFIGKTPDEAVANLWLDCWFQPILPRT